jgi:hypothetical protein
MAGADDSEMFESKPPTTCNTFGMALERIYFEGIKFKNTFGHDNCCPVYPSITGRPFLTLT